MTDWQKIDFDIWLAEVKAKAAAEALEKWVGEWPTFKKDGTFLAEVARVGLERADLIRREAGL